MALRFLNNGYFAGSVGIGTDTFSTGKVVISQSGGTQLHLISPTDTSGSVEVTLRLTSSIDYRGRGIQFDNSDAAGKWFTGVPYQGGAYSIGYHATLPEYRANSKLFINTSGNVGIGTDSPGAKLEISDTNKAINTPGNLFVSTTDTLAVDKGGQISLGGVWSGTSKIQFAGIAGRKENATSGNAGGYLQLSTTNSSGGALTERMRINSGGNVGIGSSASIAGRVDIKMDFSGENWVPDGTSAEWAKVWVSGGTTGTYFNDTMLHVNTNRGGGATGGVVGMAFSPGWSNHQNWGIYSFNTSGSANTEGDLAFVSQINAGTITERVRFQGATGNVGIGTTTPGAPLAVQANFTANGGYTTSGWAKYIILDAENTGGGGIIWTKQSSTYNRAILNNQGKFEIGRSAANDDSAAWLADLVIDATGNVGIGEDNPSTLLSLSSIANNSLGGITLIGNTAGDKSNIWTQDIYSKWLHTENSVDAPNGYGRIDFETNAASNSTYPNRGGFSFTTAGAGQFVTFTNEGNVGIKTSLPIHPLYVNGDIGQSDGGRIWFRGSSSSSTTGSQSYVYSNGLNLQIKGDDNVQLLGDGGGVIAHFDYTGKVGISTTLPKSKLQVDGGIQMADDTDTAVADKAGTMRYRTATDEPVPITGTDLVTNGDLASSTGWGLQNSAAINTTTGVATVPAGSTYSGAISATGGNWSLYQSNVMGPSKTYMLRFQARRDAGPNANMYAGWAYQVAFSQTVTAAWVQYQVVFTTGTQTWNELTFGGVTGTTFEVKDIAVVEVTLEDASYADMCMQTGASTYEWVNIVRNTY